MQSNSLSNGLPSGLTLQSDERRKRRRFEIHFAALLRALNDSWAVCETDDVSSTGAFLFTDRPFLVSAPVEYVLTFPPDLTKVANSLRVRFFGKVLRCERVPDNDSVFGIAVQSAAYRYLSQEQSLSFDAIEQKLSATVSSAATIQPLQDQARIAHREARATDSPKIPRNKHRRSEQA
jgi:PilZ domain